MLLWNFSMLRVSSALILVAVRAKYDYFSLSVVAVTCFCFVYFLHLADREFVFL